MKKFINTLIIALALTAHALPAASSYEENPVVELNRAIKLNDLASITFWIKEVNLCTQDIDGNTPLHLAIIHNNKQATAGIIFVAKEKDILHKILNTENNDGNTPLELAQLSNNKEHLKYIISMAPKQIQPEESKQKTIRLFKAIDTNNINELEQLLTQSNLCPALHYATKNNKPECVHTILNYAQEKNMLLETFNATNLLGQTVLHLAAINGFTLCMQEIIILVNGDPKTLNLRDSKNQTALHLAAQNDHEECVRILLAAGADTEFSDNHGNTPAQCARQNGHEDIANIIEKNEKNKKEKCAIC
ncbi:ankyrin repeat domain-containing protein [Candidatus Babeliales bacterium]|nr:ankyrin repeat domain-containing protein [Candidatus Babeliales bacterium]